MLAKYIIEKYGYKWDDNWTDTDNILEVLQTMDSLHEDLLDVAQDCVKYLRPKKYNVIVKVEWVHNNMIAYNKKELINHIKEAYLQDNGIDLDDEEITIEEISEED